MLGRDRRIRVLNCSDGSIGELKLTTLVIWRGRLMKR